MGRVTTRAQRAARVGSWVITSMSAAVYPLATSLVLAPVLAVVITAS